ncbi:deoxyribodipyrimidine photolyase [Tenacibaculum sp. SZ-18]|uniref:cryptochrome/deoxyribodipyrimidine photo-lyase family protein n=1 Tax=Tenacibaculum sp. SZ-18 TaxID=754423 RepID=UPI000C2CE653|nr:deoxyribodipyrimidine photo-lyase [Tenacibaculum sp. SZ-18]AUC14972.1 deoxyribodipyrimidine photolyase [Tenacibaculum sp. SZ-18]
MKNKENIAIVWLKRDLRLHDNEALHKAINSNKRVLILYVFENLLLNDPHYSDRHWNFIKQSLSDINKTLSEYNTKVLSVTGDIFAVFNQLQTKYVITDVYSHQETGLLITFNRDKEFARYCRNNSIEWTETINNGVLRGLLNRDDWFERWEDYMYQPQIEFNGSEECFISLSEIHTLSEYFRTTNLKTKDNSNFQYGGTKTAWKYANSFFDGRYENYMFHISKPEASRTSCSRLSPYIAWGNVSIREIFQKAKKLKESSSEKRHLGAFISRLRWQAHFIQKFEMECTMENASINKGYHKLKKSISETYIKAWETGQTGFPLVDASMRCLNETGFINFRMRAMLVSFFTHILWQPWQQATHHLSKNFLDFEPGIHFPQLQMQAGETGINNLRIYNPVKNSHDHDPDAVFIKKWVPELANLPVPFIHEPYLMTPLDQQFNNCIIGKDYPSPIVDIKENRKRASEILWNMKKDKDVLRESLRILKKHTINNRSRMLRDE